jgi:hypothetical protein
MLQGFCGFAIGVAERRSAPCVLRDGDAAPPDGSDDKRGCPISPSCARSVSSPAAARGALVRRRRLDLRRVSDRRGAPRATQRARRRLLPRGLRLRHSEGDAQHPWRRRPRRTRRTRPHGSSLWFAARSRTRCDRRAGKPSLPIAVPVGCADREPAAAIARDDHGLADKHTKLPRRRHEHEPRNGQHPGARRLARLAEGRASCPGRPGRASDGARRRGAPLTLTAR